MTKVEGGLDNVGQEHRNFSLIITGLHPEFQNANGVIGFAREVLGVYIDPFELSEVMRLGVTKKGLTITKVIFFSVGSRIRVYQARVAMRGNSKGIFINEDLTKGRERLCYMTRVLYNEKAIAKNWTFLGKVFLKKTAEAEVVEINKKEDLVAYDINGTLRKMDLL